MSTNSFLSSSVFRLQLKSTNCSCKIWKKRKYQYQKIDNFNQKCITERRAVKVASCKPLLYNAGIKSCFSKYSLIDLNFYQTLDWNQFLKLLPILIFCMSLCIWYLGIFRKFQITYFKNQRMYLRRPYTIFCKFNHDHLLVSN